jgi:tRNA threonylcarbamoyladenosine biosynthesis protein TsaE
MEIPITTNLNDIPALAKTIAGKLKGGEIFALIGTLGAGKTTFVKAIGKELKIKHHITSPTFALLNCFPVKIKQQQILVYHLDLYRTKGFAEAKSLGLTEFWGAKHTVTFIEWADKIQRHLPTKTQVIKFLN